MKYKIYLRTDSTNIDGSNSLYLSYTFKRTVKKFQLGIKVMPKNWNKNKIEVRTSDRDFLYKNRTIRMHAQKAGDIINKYFMENKLLTIEEFTHQFKGATATSSIFDYIDTEIKTFTHSAGTLANYIKQTSKLKSFKEEINFSEIDNLFLKKYDYFLKETRGNNENTRIASMNFLRQIINKAKKAGVTDIKPFEFYKVGTMKGNRDHLTKSEIDKLENLLKENSLLQTEIDVLEYFLFSCYTGLRYSDILTFKYSDIQTDIIDGVEYGFIVKTMQKTQKTTDIPILSFAYKFIKPSTVPNQKVFKVQTNQATNRTLKRIMQIVGINKVISFHCARHTIGTTGIDLGVPIEVISRILGHSQIKETQGYSKISRRAMVNNMQKFNV